MAKKKTVKVNDEGLEELINDIVQGCAEDLEEADQNVAFYKTEILNNPLGKESFGFHLNEALKIKGSARDRVIKMLNLIKDRVKSKEFLDKAKNTDDMSPENLVKGLDAYFKEDDEEVNE